jgi:hypothetical protein
MIVIPAGHSFNKVKVHCRMIFYICKTHKKVLQMNLLGVRSTLPLRPVSRDFEKLLQIVEILQFENCWTMAPKGLHMTDSGLHRPKLCLHIVTQCLLIENLNILTRCFYKKFVKYSLLLSFPVLLTNEYLKN